ncbi:MAG: phospho-N-acetylmuramoyl-pentapeptide-transferase [Butyrivibrio sp.]|nr:phospho-N-acetylmuramoyl-pentapeptide-transferase [Butyrivibrio sp.]
MNATIPVITMLAGFGLTWLLLKLQLPFLPRDHGRAFAVNGTLSKGKLRGVGLVFMAVFLLLAAVNGPMDRELVINLVLLAITTLAGYLDDAALVPWGEYRKGAIDLGVSIAATVNFIAAHGTQIRLFGLVLELPYVVYLILGTVLVWAAINVTNCADGVDGLCASLVILSGLSFAFLFPEALGAMAGGTWILAAILAAYLCFNASPSSMLMGDAGSRPLGLFLAILAMRSGHPFAYLLLSAILILDGGLGLFKISVIRFLKWKNFLHELRTPIHDELRAKRGWSDTQVVSRYMILQGVLSAICALLLRLGGTP